MLEIVIAIFAAAFVLLGGVIFYRLKRPSNNEPVMLIQHQLEALREQLRLNLEGNSSAISEQRKSMDGRLDNAARVIGDVQKAIGQLKEAITPISEIRDILKAPKQRGIFGEIMLEKLLEEMMPPKFYETQYLFSDGKRIDAVIKLGESLVCIDSKFPLEKYQEYLNAKSEDEKRALRRQVITAVKKHMGDVAKYIRPDEGTYPFALMYIPSESIYYELFVSNMAEDSLWPYASQLRVFPVSSNTLYLYLQTVSFGLRGMKMAEDVQSIFAKLERLAQGIGGVKDCFGKVGTHLKNAQKAYDESEKKLDKFEDKFLSLSSDTVPELKPGIEEEKEEEPAIQ